MKQHYRDLAMKFGVAADKLAAARIVRREHDQRAKDDVQQKAESVNTWESEGGNSASPRHADTKGLGVFVNSNYLAFNAGGDFARDATTHAQRRGHKGYSVR